MYQEIIKMNGWNEIMKEFLEVLKDVSWRIWIRRLRMIVGIGTLIFGGCHYLNQAFGLEDDNPIEQGVEAVIKHRTGLFLDLTP